MKVLEIHRVLAEETPRGQPTGSGNLRFGDSGDWFKGVVLMFNYDVNMVKLKWLG